MSFVLKKYCLDVYILTVFSKIKVEKENWNDVLSIKEAVEWKVDSQITFCT
jgi:hypothetical protein